MPFVYLFSESAGRALVTVPRGQDKAFMALCEDLGVPVTALGVTDPAGGALDVRGQFTIGLDELRTAFESTLPRFFGDAAAVVSEVPVAPVAGTEPAAAAATVAAVTVVTDESAASAEAPAADGAPIDEAPVAQQQAIAEEPATEAPASGTGD
jgi:phosphoribosylformylglycinamidine synthase